MRAKVSRVLLLNDPPQQFVEVLSRAHQHDLDQVLFLNDPVSYAIGRPFERKPVRMQTLERPLQFLYSCRVLAPALLLLFSLSLVRVEQTS